jgi:hypothetical protein
MEEAIICPECKQPHYWSAARLDQRCYQCRYEAQFTAPVPDAATGPRLAVEGDIYPEPVSTFWNMYYWNAAASTAKTMSFSEWAQNIRTQKLMELNDRLRERERDANERALNLQDRFNAQYDRIKDLERDCAAAHARADKVESDLRLEQALRAVYQRCAVRRRKWIEGLHASLTTDNDFIKLLQRRLINARNHLARVRRHCDILEVGDNGQEFDV